MKTTRQILLLILLTSFCSLNIRSQVHPDSLRGIYAGMKYFKYSYQTNWDIWPDTIYITSIDTNACEYSYHYRFIAKFETDYNFCNNNSSVWPPPIAYHRFYAGDSFSQNYIQIPQPFPNTHSYTKIFKGKRLGFYASNENILKHEHIKLHPNPVSDVLYIIPSTYINISDIFIYNINGQLLDIKKLNSGGTLFEINVANLKSGLYFIRLSTNNKFFNSKFIKF